MKKLKYILMLFVSLSVMSCDKETIIELLDDNFVGSFSLNINGTTYNTLLSDILEMNEGVTFFADDNDGGIFQIAITDVPAVGETAVLDLNGDENGTAILIIDSPVEGNLTLISGAGTVKRISELEYEIDATLFGGDNFMEPFPISGTVKVGVETNLKNLN